MEFTIKNNEKKKYFIQVFQNLKTMNDCTSIFMRKDKMYAQGMDSTHVSVYELNFEKEWFDSFEVKEEVILGVNLNIFAKILGVHKLNQNIHVKMLDEDSLEISFLGAETDFDKIFKMPLVNLDQDILNITEIDHDLEFSMDLVKFKNTIDELSQFGDVLRILYEKNSEEIIFEVNDEVNGKVRAVIGLDDLEECVVSDDVRIDCSFNIKKIKSMMLSTRLLLSIKLSNDVPLQLLMLCVRCYLVPMQGA